MERSEFETELRSLLTHLDEEQEKLVRKAATVQDQLKEIDKRREAVRETLRAYCLVYGLPFDETEIDHTLRLRFKDMTTKQALIELAREHGGVLATKEATHTLMRAGMFSNPRNASGSIHGLLSRAPELFERISRGRYRLRTKEQPVNGRAPNPGEFMPQTNYQVAR